MAITDPAVLAAELERVRHHYNAVRLHEAIGYVTPNDEHEGRGDAIRAARRDGIRVADEQRRALAPHPPETSHDSRLPHQQQPADNHQLLSESTQQLSR